MPQTNPELQVPTAKLNGKKNNTFFMLSPNVGNQLLDCDLTAAEWRMWCYLVTLDPFGDSGAKFSPAELMLKCGIKKTAYFKAKAKFQKLGLFDFKDAVTKVINLQGKFSQSAKTDSTKTDSAKTDSQSANADSQSANADSQSAKTDSQSANADSQIPEPAPSADPGNPQTIQTIQTLQTGVGVRNAPPRSSRISNPAGSAVENSPPTESELIKKESDGTQQDSYSEVATVREKEIVDLKDPREEESSANVVQITTKGVTRTVNSDQLPEDLVSKLEDLGISIDAKVRQAIADHHISQAYGAIRHIEDTWETINNPRGVFLHQIPLQRVKKGPKPLSEEFQKWYQWAIADGLVVDYPAKYLPTNLRGEPKVKLVANPEWSEDWKKVRDNPSDYRQLIDPKEVWGKVGSLFKRPPEPEPEPTLNEQMNDPILGPELYQKIKHTHDVSFTEEGRPYQATEIIDVQYSEEES